MNRRKFLAGIGATAAGGVAAGTIDPVDTAQPFEVVIEDYAGERTTVEFKSREEFERLAADFPNLPDLSDGFTADYSVTPPE